MVFVGTLSHCCLTCAWRASKIDLIHSSFTRIICIKGNNETPTILFITTPNSVRRIFWRGPIKQIITFLHYMHPKEPTTYLTVCRVRKPLQSVHKDVSSISIQLHGINLLYSTNVSITCLYLTNDMHQSSPTLAPQS